MLTDNWLLIDDIERKSVIDQVSTGLSLTFNDRAMSSTLSCPVQNSR